MVDNNQDNDEYQFSDMDVINPDKMDDDLVSTKSMADGQEGTKKDVRRNALIVVGLIILAMIAYKFMGAIFSSKKTPVPATTTLIKPLVPPVITKPSSVTPVPVVTTKTPDSQTEQKLSALEFSQQTIRTEVTSINNQLGGLTSNVNDLTAKIDALTQSLNILSAKMEQQSHEIEVLTVRAKPAKVVTVVRKSVPRPMYYIQAVIPGRAWLIATNGSTLTVREGTIIPGFGTVKLIDPVQGRVLMSTGQIIRFSQQDS